MSSSPSAPAPPDYSGVANASQRAAELAYQTSKEQLDWAKEQYADSKPYTDEVRTKLMDSLDENTANAKKDRARYEEIYQPLEDQAAKDAQEWDNPDRMAANRGRAAASVAGQFDAAGEAAKRSLESYGLDPSSTRYAALDVNTRLAKAAATAGAANGSDRQTMMEAQGLRAGAINTGKGYPAQINAATNTANSAGSAGNTAMNQTTGTYSSSLGNGAAWQGLGNQSVGTWGSTLSNMYNSQVQAYGASQYSSSGVGAALGGLAGIGLRVAGFEEGGMVPEEVASEGNMPRAIPASMSPSGGAVTDDVPAMVNGRPAAAINVGEFVMPKDTVRWYGEKYLQDLILKAEKGIATAGAKPEVKRGGIPMGGAAPRQSAIPA